MAFLELHFRSDALAMDTAVNVILPDAARQGGTYRTLWLLHGLKGDHWSWMRQTAIERYAAAYGIAVVMPDGARSWYTDTADHAAYLTYITKELPDVCRGFFRGMSDARADNFIAGLSMGGYGAIKAALTCPDRYGGCASLSGSADIARRERKIDLEEWRGIFGYDLTGAAALAGGEHDIFAIARKNREGGVPFPKMYLWCGTEDSLIGDNRRFADLLTELDVPHRWEESEGDHSWRWWDLHIRDAMRYLFEE